MQRCGSEPNDSLCHGTESRAEDERLSLWTLLVCSAAGSQQGMAHNQLEVASLNLMCHSYRKPVELFDEAD